VINFRSAVYETVMVRASNFSPPSTLQTANWSDLRGVWDVRVVTRIIRNSEISKYCVAKEGQTELHAAAPFKTAWSPPTAAVRQASCGSRGAACDDVSFNARVISSPTQQSHRSPTKLHFALPTRAKQQPCSDITKRRSRRGKSVGRVQASGIPNIQQSIASWKMGREGASGRGRGCLREPPAPEGGEEPSGKGRGGKAEIAEGQTAARPAARGAGSDATERAKAGEQFRANICVGFKKSDVCFL